MKNWSTYQLAVFKNVSEGTGHTVVNAVAGSGKCLGLGTPVMLHDGTVKGTVWDDGNLRVGADGCVD